MPQWLHQADCHPVSHIQNFASPLSGKIIFSKIDLIKGYHQILVHAMDIPKTAVIIAFGLFEFLHTPSIQHFQYFLEGRQFSLFTDHNHSLSPTIRSQMPGLHGNSTSSQRSLDIRHVAGKDNVVADTLSRAAILANSGAIDFSALTAAQLQIQLTWLPVGQQLWDFNLRAFLLDLITQLYYVMCLLVGHVPSYLSPSATVFVTLFMASATQAYGQPTNW